MTADLTAAQAAVQKVNQDLTAVNNATLAAFLVTIPQSLSESPDMTTVTPGNGVICDAKGNSWDLNASTLIEENGKGAFNGWQSNKMVYHNHLVYIFGLDGSWYNWNGNAFVGPVAAP